MVLVARPASRSGALFVCRPRRSAAHPRRIYESADAALERFAAAQVAAAARLNAVAEDQRDSGFENEAGIFECQALLVEDPVADR